MKAHEKYYLKACKALGKTPLPVLEDRSDKDAISVDAYARLIACISFKNMVDGKRWIPVYDGSEWHYYAYLRINDSGSGFSFSITKFLVCVFVCRCAPRISHKGTMPTGYKGI